mmetsp:Transcript_26076/g.64762  ORF Transcript_26076/g.64762 Transcript_26076/m.64762 type:complete len:226 (-) Transcript_26076:318-995(-)
MPRRAAGTRENRETGAAGGRLGRRINRPTTKHGFVRCFCVVHVRTAPSAPMHIRPMRSGTDPTTPRQSSVTFGWLGGARASHATSHTDRTSCGRSTPPPNRRRPVRSSPPPPSVCRCDMHPPADSGASRHHHTRQNTRERGARGTVVRMERGATMAKVDWCRSSAMSTTPGSLSGMCCLLWVVVVWGAGRAVRRRPSLSGRSAVSASQSPCKHSVVLRCRPRRWA